MLSQKDKERAAALLELRRREREKSTQGTRFASAEGIVEFVVDVLHADPAPYQSEILSEFFVTRRMSVRSLHGVGKTALSSWVILWGMVAFTDDTKVVTTAGSWGQLTHFTWPEVHKWAMQADWSKAGVNVRHGKELLERSIKLPNKEAFAVASDNPMLIEGAHASKLIYVFDEAKAINPATWDAVEGAFSTGDCWALAISTPGATAGRFYDIHRHRPGYEDWRTKHISLEQAIKAGRVSQEWVDQRKKQWGEKSALYQNRVLGEFSDSEEDSVIPLSWVEAANERYYDWQANPPDRDEITEESYGVDVAYKGNDKTAIAHKENMVIVSLDYYVKQSTMETAGIIAGNVDKSIPVAIDSNGVGAGVYDRLEEQGYNVAGVNVGESANISDVTGQKQFVNLRSAIWWLIRDHLDPDGDLLLALPPDDTLTGDLTAPTYKYTSKGAVAVEPKDEMRKRLGRSPDGADAVGMALYAPIVCGLEGFGSDDW